MVHPAKWRETADPFQLPYRRFRLTEVLGYPHAGNDVFHVRGMAEGRTVTSLPSMAHYGEMQASWHESPAFHGRTGEGRQRLCHGGFRYANVLWQDGWFPPPGTAVHDHGGRGPAVPCGLLPTGSFDEKRLTYFLVNDYAWFLGVGAEERDYTAWVREWQEKHIG